MIVASMELGGWFLFGVAILVGLIYCAWDIGRITARMRSVVDHEWRTGRALRKRYGAKFGRRPSYGATYVALRRLEVDGWVERSHEGADVVFRRIPPA